MIPSQASDTIQEALGPGGLNGTKGTIFKRRAGSAKPHYKL